MKSSNSIDCVDDRLQSTMSYVYIGSKTQLFESDMTKSFLNNQNLKPYSDSTLSEKNRTLRFSKPDIPVFATSPFVLKFFSIGSLSPFNIFSGLKTSLIFKSLSPAPIMFMF
jgi:hypothetical protein